MANKLELIFLGTSSAMPSKTRNVSSLALRINDGDSIWLFDCGEGTQHQIIRTEKVKLTKVNKIFITHNHGDHVFGVFGLLLTASGIQGLKEPKFHLVGPKGLRQLIRTALSLTHSRLAGSYRVDELLFPDDSSPSCREEGKLECEEIGSDIYLSEEDGYWHIPQDDDRFEEILAAPIEHSIPTVGYVINEKPIPGALNPDLIKPKLLAAKEEFMKVMNIKNPMSLLSKLKNGEEIIFPDGSKVTPADVIGPPKPGRKIVILGDTSNPLAISPLAYGCDVVVHEATNSIVGENEGNAEEIEGMTRCHGHSTPQMAGSFAASIGAKHLILNHFSSRYKGDDSAESLDVMNQIKQLAISSFQSEEVSTAYDLFTYNIPRSAK